MSRGASLPALGSSTGGTRPVGGMSLGSVLGVRLEVDWSVLIIFALILFDLGLGVFPAWHPDWSPALSWGVALGAALCFFASILAHELSHAVVARRNGIPVPRITLFLFGGLAHMEREPPSPRSEFLMAIVGPVASLIIGAVSIAAGLALAGPGFGTQLAQDPQAAVAALGPLPSLLLWLGPINVVLAVFNIVPGFPLDGGRVLRSLVWGITGDLRKATRWASATGRAFAWGLMGWGLLALMGGAPGQGIWLLLIGWFLNNAARASYEQLVVHESLGGVALSEVMRTRFSTVHPETAVEELLRELLASGQRAVPVVDAEGRLAGLVGLEDVRQVPQSSWAGTPVARVMQPAAQLTTLDPDAGAEEALRTLARRGVDQVPVLDHGRPVGLVSSQDLVRWLSLRLEPRAAPARGTA